MQHLKFKTERNLLPPRAKLFQPEQSFQKIKSDSLNPELENHFNSNHSGKQSNKTNQM
jgi:hypothetical protein